MTPTRTVFLRDLVLPARIGVYASEEREPQRIRIDLECDVDDPGGVGEDAVSRVVDYAELHRIIGEEVATGHVRLVETLAERIAARILQDRRIASVRVRVEKLDIYPTPTAAGVLVSRHRQVVP